MERHLTLKPLSIQDENSAIHRKKAAIDGKSKNSRPISKKAGAAGETRRALNDITNKSSVHIQPSSQKKSTQDKKPNIVENRHLHHHVFDDEVSLKGKGSTKEEINIAEEGFLHDHGKCIEAEKAEMKLNFWDTVLPGHDSAELTTNQVESDLVINNTDCFVELEELSMSEFFDWYESQWKSPPTSPINLSSAPLSPFAWELEPSELQLKEEDDCHV